MVTASLMTGSRFEGRYEILGELGASSFGHVYQARQLSAGQSLAIKLLSPRQPGLAGVGLEATDAGPLLQQLGG